MKTCSKCQTSKPLAQFCVRRSALDGRDGWCQECKKQATTNWRKTHTKHISSYRRKWRRENRPLVLAEKERYRRRHPERARKQVRAAHKKHGKLYRTRRYFVVIEERYGLTKAQVQAQTLQAAIQYLRSTPNEHRQAPSLCQQQGI